jgi:RimJ/RimL family protein N-acetyltransferase
MSEAEFGEYSRSLVEKYAAQGITSGAWESEQGHLVARRTINTLLRDGVASPNQFLFSVVDGADDRRIGWAWASWTEANRGSAAVLDLEIESDHRRRGYATATLRALEEFFRARGAARVTGTVFGHNRGMWCLAEKLGYVVTVASWAKSLTPPVDPRAADGMRD